MPIQLADDTRPARRGGFHFFGAVGVVMALLKLKQHVDEQYAPLPTEEHLPLPPAYNDHDAGADARSVDTTLPVNRPRRAKRAGCCVCCGLDCTLFWKAIGIVMLALAVWNVGKFALWAAKPTPTGLENMPKFGTGLGCDGAAAQHGWTNASTIALGYDGSHLLQLTGAAVATLRIGAAPAGQRDVSYEISAHASSAPLLDLAKVDWAVASGVLSAPPVLGAGGCVRFDVVMRVPIEARSLRVRAETLTHVVFEGGADAVRGLWKLEVMLFSGDARNVLVSHEDVQAERIHLQATSGYVVGGVSISKYTRVEIRSDAVASIDAHPYGDSDEPATLETIAYSARTDVTYHASAARRPIVSKHRSQARGELRLTYAAAAFNGLVDVDAKSFSMHNVQNAGSVRYAGDRDGGDSLEVHSNGWVGLYF